MGTPKDLPLGFSLVFSDAAQHPSRGQRSHGLPRSCLPEELPAATLLPGHSCPFLREETKVPFCGIGRAAAVATSDRAAGQSPTPLPSRPLSSAALGLGATHGLGAVPASLWLRATNPRGMLLPKKQDGVGESDRRSFSQMRTRTCIVVARGQGRCSGRAPSTVHPLQGPHPHGQPRVVT